MVRLKAALEYGTNTFKHIFQFQYGAIKSYYYSQLCLAPPAISIPVWCD